ncbi:MAG TPA: M23 family metallopeptidase [Rhodocyclaceae bacterium]|nr:M23 family metallopeptidase [Rhodocyclaceae bacterium]
MPIKEKSRILAQLNQYRLAKPKHFWAAAGVASVSMLGMVTAFGTAPGTQPINITQQTVVEQLATPQAATVSNTEAPQPFVREERILRGDTVAALLNRVGADDPAALNFLLKHGATQAVSRQLSPGKTVTAQIGSKGELLSLVFPLNGGQDKALYVERQGDGSFTATERSLPTETTVQIKSAEIRSSLFGATDAADIPDSVATQLADIFGGDIDFNSDLRRGDRFSVVYELISSQGKPLRTGRILAAEFTNDGKTYRAFWYGGANGNDRGGYYGEDGKSLRKAFLRSPLEFTRVTSGFTLARYHPVLHTWRAHKGIDLAAAIGTKVKATGDGVVEFIGQQHGYGNVVILRHQSRYETVYGHLSRFTSGLRVGSRVSQGDIIAYTGMSGMATGPHLHYEFRVNGVFENPMTIALPGAPALTNAQLSEFKRGIQPQLAQLGMARISNLALLN